jgi:Bacteriophage replication gene A protein (GPA)
MKTYADRARLSSVQGTHRYLPPFKFAPLHEIAAPNITTLPADLVAPLVREFNLRNEALDDWESMEHAREWIRAEVREFKKNRLDIAFSEEEIELEAEKWAAICRSLVTYEATLPYVQGLGVRIPEIKGTVTAEGIYQRFVNKRWWRCQFRKLFTREAEAHLRSIGHVQMRKQLYASDRAVDWHRSRKLRDRTMLQGMVAVSDAGDQLELWNIVEHSLANPALRRGELMVRLKGFEEIADSRGDLADFYTLTTPSAFHRTLRSGIANPSWKNFTIRDAQGWLRKIWARVRATLKRLSILFYGFRIAEPHHDGTPHWHVVMFYPAHQRDTVRTIIREAWLSEYGDEAGARAVRSKVTAIDRAKGSACGYVAKYIAKNIDGFEVGEDYESEEIDGRKTQAESSVARVAAWASANSIRQFQQVGGPQITLYRELRRVRADCRVDQIETARAAADAGDFSGFVAAVGGIHLGRRGALQLDTSINGELTQYDELRGPQVVGVMCAAGRIKTRLKIWRIELKGLAKFVPNRPFHKSTQKQTEAKSVPIKVWKCETCGKKFGQCRCGILALSPSYLGPVSLTVRNAQSVPATGGPIKKGPNSTRGSPWKH